MNQHDQIVKRFDLKATNFQYGQTFVQGIIVYQIADDFYMAEWNTLGERTEGKWILFQKSNPCNRLYLYSDFLLDFPIQEMQRMIYGN